MKKITKKGKAIISIALLLTILLLLIITNTIGDLNCQLETAISCSQGTALLYMQNATGGWDNAHAENASSATYSNILCCNSTNNTLNTFCGDNSVTFLNLSAETNAHVEDPSYTNYDVASCINVNITNQQPNMSCSIEPTGCPSDSICMLSMASDGADNKTNAHVSSCGVYDTEVCCHINTIPTVVDLNIPTNYSNFSAVPEFNWSNSTDADNDVIYYLLQVDNDPTFAQPISYSNVSIKETENATGYIYTAGDFTEGHWFWRVLATDLQDNASAWSEARYFTYDETEPSIIVNYPGNTSILYTKDDGTPGRTLSINFTVNELPSGMKDTIAAAWWVNSSGTTNSTELVFTKDSDEDTRQYSINITDWGPDGEINVSIWVNDSAGNEEALHYYTYSILTESVPQVEWISPLLDDGNPILVGDGFDILVNATANATAGGAASINYTWLEVDYPNGSIVNLTMDNSSVTEFFYNFTTDFPDGFYDMRVYANYTETGKEGTAGTVLRREADNTAPNITAGNITVGATTFYNNSWSKYGDLTYHFEVADNWTTKGGDGADNHEIKSCNLTYLDLVGGGNADYNVSKDSPNKNQDETIPLASENTLTDGSYNWTITCTDEAGNIGTDDDVKVINVDVSYPQFEAFDYPAENEVISKNQTINLTISDISFGVNHTWLETNNSEGIQINNESMILASGNSLNGSYTYEWDTRLYEDGPYTINVYANDSANNENITIRTVTIDNSGPNITLESPPNNSISGTKDNTFQALVWDASSIINCSLIINDEVNVTNSPIINNTIQSFFTELTTDTYTWTVNCTDEENNIGTNLTIYTRTVDLDNPVINLTVPPDPVEFYTENASINWSIIEPNIDTNYTDVTLPNGTRIDRYYDNLTLSAQDNLTLLGTYSVSTYVNDSAAHEITADATFTVRDTIAPSVILVSPGNGTIQNSSDITFSFNISDYHSVANCTLWLNQTESYTNTTMTNDITVMQNLNLTNITDEEDVPWNITCYDNSSNLNNTEEAIYIDIDTTLPLIDFINPTDMNNSYVSRSWTYINVSITEPHNDTFVLVWNYTTNYTSGIDEDTIIAPGEGNIIFYERNVTGLTDGIYEYYIFANDTLANESTGHSNVSETRTITIDETPPTAFDLLDPSDGAELTDDTPALNWQDSTDINFDNYSIELSTEENFATIDSTFSSTTSYYAIQEAEALSELAWYWRVKAIDKANNQRLSTSTFSFTIGDVAKPTVYIGPGGGGGGGGGRKIVSGVVDIIQPGIQTLYEGETIITPLIIRNTGRAPIRGITLKATASSPAIALDLSKTYIDFIAAEQEYKIDLKIIATGTVGEYEVTVEAEAREPTITDQAKFYVNLIGFGMGKKTILDEKLRFVGKLFESNPECLELREMVEEAKKELEKKDYDKSLELIETAITSCEQLVKTIKERRLEKPTEPKKTLYLLLAEILFFIFMFIMIYRYYKRRFYKGPIVRKRKKTVPAFILLIIIFLGGFFILNEYTGFTVFEDINFDSSSGTYSNTEPEHVSGEVRLTAGSTIGNFTSQIFNANFTVDWQTINWSWGSTANDNITMDVRTSYDNIMWSSWSENVTNTSKIPDAKTIWTNEEDFIGIVDDTSITNPAGNITLNTDGINYNEIGTFTSESLDLGFVNVNITTIEFTIINTSSQDNITIETSTSSDNETWETWKQTNVSGDQVYSTDNEYFKWRATLVTNDTEITPALEDLTVNYERNSTYIQYRATFTTDDDTETPSLEGVNITYQDATVPLFEFLNPTEANGTCISNNFTYINFTRTEPNNDSFYVYWNGTQYNPIDMNETAQVSEGVYSYGINLKELVEGIYEYYIWANDTYGHENQTANRTVTVDQTSPAAFSLLNPSDGNRSTDNTPFLLWEDSNDTNLDNYTIEFATNTNFREIEKTYYNTSANYQIDGSESLSSNGIFYWHVIAYDKAGQNYTTSYFTYYVGFLETTAFVPGTAGEGGGGGKRVERRQAGLELIKPEALSFFANRQIIVPLLLVNDGTETLKGIELTAESPALDIELKPNLFPVLRPKEEIDPQLVINPVEDPGRYNILVKADVTEPEFTDAIMFFIDIVEFGLGNKTEAQDKLIFVVDFIKSREECSELEKFVIEAQEAFSKNEFDKVLKLTEQAVQSCKDLVSTAKTKKLEKKKISKFNYYLSIVEIILFLIIFSGVYSYYKRLKFKRRMHW